MRKGVLISLMPLYVIMLSCCLLATLIGNHTAIALSENAPIKAQKYVIIDAGHGGVDGGTTSCTGVLESKINLQIAQKLNDLMHLLGIHTRMIRNTDSSVHTEGNTIASKKISDLKERVRIVNQFDEAVLISIHQNHFTDQRYHGTQVFYAPAGDSKNLATQIQRTIRNSMQSDNDRQIKKADGIYLMQHIQCTGVLIECGFLSNPEEEAKLLKDDYQKNICCVLASTLSRYLYGTDMIA